MELADGTILMHEGAPYDPAKAHLYYLRTRQLKGRKRSSTVSVRKGNEKQITLTPQQLIEQRVYAAKRVAEIKEKLHLLNRKLREAMREARKKKAEADKPKTAAEKSKEARDSKQYRAKHRTSLATKTKQSTKTHHKSDPVSELEDKIVQVKKRLATAVAIQRSLNGATKNN